MADEPHVSTRQLSVGFADWRQSKEAQQHLDAVVIGSGYGGAVAALRLAQLGRRVVVLERGGEYLPGDFPNDLGEIAKYVRAQGPDGPTANPTGLFEFRSGPGVVSLVANGLGGGSLINAGVLMRPDDDVFALPAWPHGIRHGDSRWPLRQFFRKASIALRGERLIGTEQLPKAQALRRTAERLHRDGAVAHRAHHVETAKATIDSQRCTQCGDCVSGCNQPGAKHTLRDTYLRRAWTRGVELVTRATVYAIEPVIDQPGEGTADLRWRVLVAPTERLRDRSRTETVMQEQAVTLEARLIVLAAGSFGSTELLMRSRERAGRDRFTLSPALGTRFSANGDSISVVAGEAAAVDAVGHGAEGGPGAKPVGPTITTVVDLRQAPNVGTYKDVRPSFEHRLVVEEAAIPGVLARVFEETLATAHALSRMGQVRAPLLRWLRNVDPDAASRRLARHTQTLLVMGHDDSAGRLVWVPQMDGVAPYWPQPETSKTYQFQQRVFDDAASWGSVHLHSPLWRSLSDDARRLVSGPTPEPMLTTVHPLGGCCMGDRFADSVVNEFGEVWRADQLTWPNLLVLDGSIVPTSLGCNPLWTIAALAERAMSARRHLFKNPRDTASGPRRDVAAAPQREPQPMKRSRPPTFQIMASERLVQQRLVLRGGLAKAMNWKVAEAELIVDLRSPDWIGLWEDPRHRITDVGGRLRLAQIPATTPQTPAATADQEPPETGVMDYKVQSGSVDLLPLDRKKWGLGWLFRMRRLVLALWTWYVLRGKRDLSERCASGPRTGILEVLRWVLMLIKTIWSATEVRRVTYDLQLQTQHARDLGPARLRVRGSKRICYAARASQLWRYTAARSRAGTTQPRLCPADLRPSVVDMLTCPDLTLDVVGSLDARLPSWLPQWIRPRTRSRFDFDIYWAMRHGPLKALGPSDLSNALLAAAAYPALVARWLARSFLLEFRAPSQSGCALVDDAGPQQVRLRDLSGEGSKPVEPHEYRLHVDRGHASSDDGGQLRGQIGLQLWRYAPRCGRAEFRCGHWYDIPVRRARSVLLTHAFGMSGYMFTFQTTRQNFAEFLWADGWDVWILDTRLSPRVDGSADPGSVDLVASIDIPAAVEHILKVLADEDDSDDADPPPLQIFAFGHCLGAAALQMSLLSGKLSYERHAHSSFGVRVPSCNPEAQRVQPRLPKLAALVSSQTHLFTVGSRSSQGKTWLPAQLRDVYRRLRVPLAVREPVSSLIEAMADRVFGALPVPAGERCPHEGESSRVHDDDVATCKRVRFIDAELFKHRNLNDATHAELPRLFGDAAIPVFAQGARFVRYERLVTEDGLNAYARDDCMAEFMALPVAFLHGELNELFDAESARRSGDQVARLHPGWVKAFPCAHGRNWDVIEGYGHLDVLIGCRAMDKNGAAASPYERLSALLAKAWQAIDHQPDNASTEPAAATRAALSVRFPATGPWIGPIKCSSDGHGKKRLTCSIAFEVDDQWAESGVPGAIGAAVVWRHGRSPGCCELAVEEWYPRATSCGVRGVRSLVVRIAHGIVELDVEESAQKPLELECVTWTYSGDTGARPMPREPELMSRIVDAGHGDMQPLRQPSRVSPAATACALPAREQLIEAIDQHVREIEARRKSMQRPFPTSLSNRLRHPWPAERRYAVLDPGTLRGLNTSGSAPAGATFIVGCCRYPGFQFDRDRADEPFRQIAALLRLEEDASHAATGASPPQVDAMLMLGDQIYADATAGFADPLSPTERYVERHREAFRASGLRTVLGHVPSIMIPDDHEFNDGWPWRRPLFAGQGSPSGAYLRQRESESVDMAMAAAEAFQSMHLAPTMREQGWCQYEFGGDVRLFAIDTRRFRCSMPGHRVLSTQALWALRRWLRASKDSSSLCIVATGSVVLPRLVAGSDPANPGPDDSVAASAVEHRRVLRWLTRYVPRRFVLLSGDYHVSLMAEVRKEGDLVGAAVVAPPWYTPMAYANAKPCDIDDTCVTALGNGETVSVKVATPHDDRRGSGYGLLEVSRRPDSNGWRVKLSCCLVDHATATPERTVTHSIDL
jgi:choline dehydrogenase-like flavoprotein